MRPANQTDPLAKQPGAGEGDRGVSPMNPPDAYAPPGLEAVAVSAMHPFLRELCEEHAALSHALGVVEESLRTISTTGFTAEVETTLLGFGQLLDGDFIPHSQREEVLLFPLLHDRLMADGEHSQGRVATTAVDLMKADHLNVIRLAAVMVNFLKLASHLPDANSTLVVRDAALRHAGSLVALLRLHIFREDHIVFASAHRLISAQEFDRFQAGERV